MRAVGIRELRNKLSHYVRLVEAGETVLVTDRGTVVAELRPAGATTPTAHGFDELARRGLATLGAPNDPSAYPRQEPLLPPGRVKALLDAERGER